MRRLSRIAALLVAVPAFAAGGGSGTWLGLPLWFWALLNFLIFFGAIGYFLAKPMSAFFRNRRDEIVRDLEEAKRQRDEQERMKQEMETRIASIQDEIAALRERLLAEGRKEREELDRQGDADSARLLEQIDQETARRLSEARAALAKEAAGIAAELAWEILEKELTPEDRERIFATTLKRLEDKAEGGVR